jgi:hypothetical protein
MWLRRRDQLRLALVCCAAPQAIAKARLKLAQVLKANGLERFNDDKWEVTRASNYWKIKHHLYTNNKIERGMGGKTIDAIRKCVADRAEHGGENDVEVVSPSTPRGLGGSPGLATGMDYEQVRICHCSALHFCLASWATYSGACARSDI